MEFNLSITNGSANPGISQLLYNSSGFPPANHHGDLWYFITCTILTICGTIANISFLSAVIVERSCSAGPRILMGSLAIARASIITIFVPAVTVLARTAAVGHSSPYCYFYLGYQMAQIVTPWAEVALAISRLVAVCFPYHYRRLRNPKVCIIMVVCSWSVGVLVVALTANGVGQKVSMLPDGTCNIRTISEFGRFLGFLGSLVPYSLVGIVCTSIYGKAYMTYRGTESKSERRAQIARSLLKRLLIAKAMFASLMWCMVCFTPFAVIISLFPMVFLQSAILPKAARLASIVYYTVDPLIYFTILDTYTKSLRLWWRRLRTHQVQPGIQPTSQSHKPASTPAC